MWVFKKLYEVMDSLALDIVAIVVAAGLIIAAIVAVIGLAVAKG